MDKSGPTPPAEPRRIDLSALRLPADRGAPEEAAPAGRRSGMWGVLLLGLFVGTLAGGRGSIPGFGSSVVLDVETVAAGPVPGSRYVLSATGYLASDREAQLQFERAGRLIELAAKEGDRVSRGQVLARLDPAESQADVARAQALLEGRQRLLDELKEGSRQQEVMEAQARVREAEAGYENASSELKRFQDLQKRGVVAGQQIDQVQASDAMARARLDAARQILMRLEEGPRAQSIAVGEAQVREAEALLKTAQVRLEQMSLLAPFDGVILRKLAELGEVLGMLGDIQDTDGHVVYLMADLDHMVAEVDVSEVNLAAIRPGMPAVVILDAYPAERFPGQVERIGLYADRQKAVVPVRVTLQKGDGRLRPGMGLKVDFQETVADPALPRMLVDTGALLPGARPRVQVVEAGRVAEREVATGLVFGERTEVTSGLAAGDLVVLDPSQSPGPGARVEARVKEVGSR